MRKSKLLSWIVNVEYILHNDRSNTIGPNRQYTRAYFKKLNTNQFFDLHNPLQTPSMRWNRLLRLPCGVGKMGCVRRHIWAWGGSFSMKKTGISSEALHITRSGARVLLSVFAVNVHNPLFLVYTKPCLPSLSAWIEWVLLIIFWVRFCPRLDIAIIFLFLFFVVENFTWRKKIKNKICMQKLKISPLSVWSWKGRRPMFLSLICV